MISSNSLRRLARWWRLPLWIFAIFTGAKSFADNPILGSRRLNRAGLHVWRVKAAHVLARSRRGRLAKFLPEDLRNQFDRNGFIIVRNFLLEQDFRQLQAQILESELPTRVHQQGDTLTKRVTIDPELRKRFPALNKVFDDPRWRPALSYVSSTRSEPLYYVQTILGGAEEGPPDPQLQLHADTFHPSLKAWLFLTDVEEDGRPLTYVAGSHRPTAERLEWEHCKSMDVLGSGDRLSERGSLRIAAGELAKLGLPQPTRFAVPANTLVAIDTYGFHARGDSDKPTKRVEIWAFSRRSPFLPWVSGGLMSWKPIADRRSSWLNVLNDWADRHGLTKQHWKFEGLRLPMDS